MEQHVTVRGTRYILSRVGPDGMAPLVPFFRTVFQRNDFTLEWLRGKYAGEFGGFSGFSCVAFTESGEPVATFGMLPWPIRHGERTEIAAQAVDAATLKEHRRRGLFSRLAAMARDCCESSGASFLFAFPHPHGDSYPGFIRDLGYSHIGDLIEYRLPVHTPWFERVAKRTGGPVYRGYLRRLDRAFSAFAASNSVLASSLVSEGFAASDHTRTFHDYKKFAGSRVIDTAGGRVWLKVRHGLLLGDMEARTDEGMDATIEALRSFAARNGIHQLVFQSSPGTRFSRFFAARFTTVPCLAVVYRNFSSQIPVEALRFTFGDLDNF